MKTILLIFSIVFLILNLWSYKSYFRGTKRTNEKINASFEELRKKHGDAVDMGTRLVLAGISCINDILFIAFSVLVAIHFKHGILMGYASFIAAWTSIRTIPNVLQVLSLKLKRPFLDIFINPLDTIFLSYLVYMFIR